MSAAHLLWLDAGSPPPGKCRSSHKVQCCMCGADTGLSAERRDVFGPGFTDHDKLALPSAGHVCAACVWALGGQPPNTLRLWSIVYREDRPAPTSHLSAAYPHGPHTWLSSKADVSEIVDVLLAPPASAWVCTVPESGQIHILPWARVNRGETWIVRYEREDVASDTATFARVLWHATSLLAAGYIREDIADLDPHPGKLAKHGISVWREHAEPLKQWRRSATLALAVALTRKETYGLTRDRCRSVLDR